jgi:hypothetical protein
MAKLSEEIFNVEKYMEFNSEATLEEYLKHLKRIEKDQDIKTSYANCWYGNLVGRYFVKEDMKTPTFLYREIFKVDHVDLEKQEAYAQECYQACAIYDKYGHPTEVQTNIQYDCEEWLEMFDNPWLGNIERKNDPDSVIYEISKDDYIRLVKKYFQPSQLNTMEFLNEDIDVIDEQQHD